MDKFEKALNEYINWKYTDEDLKETYDVDLVLPPSKIDHKLLEEFNLLSPFGYGNKKLCIMSRKVFPVRVDELKGGYKRLLFRDENVVCKGMIFNKNLEIPHNFDKIVYRPYLNNWQGNSYLEYEIIDIL